MSETLCKFVPVGARFHCETCGHDTPQLKRQPMRCCPTPTGRFPVRNGHRVEDSRITTVPDCIHLGDPTHRVRQNRCGCGGPAQLYECRLFAEEVSRKPLPVTGDAWTLLTDVRDQDYRPDYRGRSCANCPRHTATQQATILHAVVRAGWQDQIRRSQFSLDSGGVAEVAHEVVPGVPEDLERQITPSVKIVLNHAFVVGAAEFVAMAARHPRQQFVALFHGTPNVTWRQATIWEQIGVYLRELPTTPNLWFACPDPCAGYDALDSTGRAIVWPNPVALPREPATTRPEPPTALITGRDTWCKAFPSAILGCVLVQRQRPLRLILSEQTGQGWIDAAIGAIGGQWERPAYQDARGWARRLRDEVSVVVQPSLSESFNYVALDALAWGRPVVGSPAIRYLPPDWTVDPNDARAIAAMIVEHLDRYEERAGEARRLAEYAAEWKNREYCGMIRRLLGG